MLNASLMADGRCPNCSGMGVPADLLLLPPYCLYLPQKAKGRGGRGKRPKNKQTYTEYKQQNEAFPVLRIVLQHRLLLRHTAESRRPRGDMLTVRYGHRRRIPTRGYWCWLPDRPESAKAHGEGSLFPLQRLSGAGDPERRSAWQTT